jgi:hypothetical protein
MNIYNLQILIKCYKSNEHDMKICKTSISHTTVIKIYRQVGINLQNDYDYTNKYKIQDKKFWKFTK